MSNKWFVRSALLVAMLMITGSSLLGCANKPQTTMTGFLSDYSVLEEVNDSRMIYISGRAREYRSFIVDPVEVLAERDVLAAEDRAEAIEYFHDRVVRAIEEAGDTVVDDPAPGVARIRIALTAVAKSTWWQKVHPASRVAGAGTGGAAMEAEILDSVTGELVGAVIQAGTGNQFDFTAYSTLADVKAAIDRWANNFEERLKDLRSESN